MSDTKKPKKQELAKVKETQALSLEQALAHPVVQQMSKKLDEMRQLVQGLPEAIGRAVAEAQRASRPVSRISGPPVGLQPQNANVEFHRKGKIIQDGKEISPEGPTQTDFVNDILGGNASAPVRGEIGLVKIKKHAREG
jgi:hypothetical protein